MKKVTSLVFAASLLAGFALSAQAAGALGISAGTGIGMGGGAGINALGVNAGTSANLGAAAQVNTNGNGTADREQGLARAGERVSEQASMRMETAGQGSGNTLSEQGSTHAEAEQGSLHRQAGKAQKRALKSTSKTGVNASVSGTANATTE